jgi:hypothetical protein
LRAEARVFSGASERAPRWAIFNVCFGWVIGLSSPERTAGGTDPVGAVEADGTVPVPQLTIKQAMIRKMNLVRVNRDPNPASDRNCGFYLVLAGKTHRFELILRNAAYLRPFVRL